MHARNVYPLLSVLHSLHPSSLRFNQTFRRSPLPHFSRIRRCHDSDHRDYRRGRRDHLIISAIKTKFDEATCSPSVTTSATHRWTQRLTVATQKQLQGSIGKGFNDYLIVKFDEGFWMPGHRETSDYVLVACYATLHPAMSVRRYFGRSVGFLWGRSQI